MFLFAIIMVLTLTFSACYDGSKSRPKYIISKDKVDLNVSFVDKKWNGKNVPKDEVCSDYHKGGGNSPAFVISNLPKETNYIILSFSDETFKGMRDGGHGIVGYEVKKGIGSVTIPVLKGETFVLPVGFISIRKHQGEQFGKKEGAYLPPCSGGKGNLYTVSIKATQREYNRRNEYRVLGDANVSLGRY